MGKIILLLIFSILVAYVMASPMYDTNTRACPKIPVNYCGDPDLKKKCDKTGICNRYNLSSPCLAGPDVVCQSEELQVTCKQRAYCLTYSSSDNTVSAKRLKTEYLAYGRQANRGIYITHEYY